MALGVAMEEKESHGACKVGEKAWEGRDVAQESAPAAPASGLPDASASDSAMLHDASARAMEDLGREFDACREMFTALGDEGRQLMFMQLLQHYGGMRVGELAEAVGLSRPTISHHLRILKEAGLVSMYSAGTKNFYHVSANLDRWRAMALIARRAEAFVAAWLRHCEDGMEPPYRTE